MSNSKKVSWETMVATLALVCTLLGGLYSVIVVPLNDKIENIESNHKGELEALKAQQRKDGTSIKALEISDARTGVHLVKLAESIDRLIVRLDK